MTARLAGEDVSGALDLSSVWQGVYLGVFTDSRMKMDGGLFVALSGDRFDGHDFLDAARDAGAVAAVVRRGTAPVPGLRLLPVEDPGVAYGSLATIRRRQITGPVVAITGQNGKTSTKEMVAAALGTRWNVHRTFSNNNNLIGVPKTILEAPDGTEALVIEAGANTLGEIRRHRDVIEPTVSIVTNAGAGHLEGFGSVEAVVREKLELTKSVELAIVGVVPSTLSAGAEQRGASRIITAGLGNADVVPEEVTLGADGRPVVSIDGHSFILGARGRHQAGNAMFAWSLAREFKLDLTAVARALGEVKLPSGRGEFRQVGQMTILNDGYNANPESFTAAIDMAAELRGKRRLVFVAGTMKELGSASDELHRAVARQLVDLKPDLLALVGDFVPAFEGLASGFGGQVLSAPDAESMAPLLARDLRGNEFVVLKGSRGAALELILPAILPPNLPD